MCKLIDKYFDIKGAWARYDFPKGSAGRGFPRMDGVRTMRKNVRDTSRSARHHEKNSHCLPTSTDRCLMLTMTFSASRLSAFLFFAFGACAAPKAPPMTTWFSCEMTRQEMRADTERPWMRDVNSTAQYTKVFVLEDGRAFGYDQKTQVLDAKPTKPRDPDDKRIEFAEHSFLNYGFREAGLSLHGSDSGDYQREWGQCKVISPLPVSKRTMLVCSDYSETRQILGCPYRPVRASAGQALPVMPPPLIY